MEWTATPEPRESAWICPAGHEYTGFGGYAGAPCLLCREPVSRAFAVERDPNLDFGTSQRWRDLRDAAALATHLIRDAEEMLRTAHGSEEHYASESALRSVRMLRALALREMRAQGRRAAEGC